jgi:hypothetical protein
MSKATFETIPSVPACMDTTVLDGLGVVRAAPLVGSIQGRHTLNGSIRLEVRECHLECLRCRRLSVAHEDLTNERGTLLHFWNHGLAANTQGGVGRRQQSNVLIHVLVPVDRGHGP